MAAWPTSTFCLWPTTSLRAPCLTASPSEQRCGSPELLQTCLLHPAGAAGDRGRCVHGLSAAAHLHVGWSSNNLLMLGLAEKGVCCTCGQLQGMLSAHLPVSGVQRWYGASSRACRQELVLSPGMHEIAVPMCIVAHNCAEI